MLTEAFTPEELARAEAVWADYQRTHDVSAHHGHVVGVDPRTGEVFLGGHTMGEIIDRLRAEGRWRPLVFWRVGYPYYSRVRPQQRRLVPTDAGPA